MVRETTEVLLREGRLLEPPGELVEKSNIKLWMEEQGIGSVGELYEKGRDIEWFWGTLAEELEWFEKWEEVLENEAPYFKWFTGAKTNIVLNALDRHVKTERRNKVAFIWEGEPGEVRKLTYEEMYRKVNRLANGLKSLGIGKGDKVGIYLPMIPELPIAMLACAKIGAVHSVVFSGFSQKALKDRLVDAEARALITCDGYYRCGKTIHLKEKADEALEETPEVKSCIVASRLGEDLSMEEGRDVWLQELCKKQPSDCETEVMDAEELLFLMYTSGTTGKPKGVMHTHGGYQVGVSQTLRFVFDLRGEDVY